MPAASATRPATRGMRGDTAAMIPAGHERTRRNLHDTWALRRSQPLVPLGFSGLVRTLGAGRGRVNPVIHSSATDLRSYPQSVHR